MSIKQEALDHYDRMIEQARKFPAAERISSYSMYSSIGEMWGGDDCLYCNKYNIFEDCGTCPFSANELCCNGLWDKMNNSETWAEWIENAIKVRQYIEEHG